jgi:imidazolonepropionase-like amidohydrolase
VLTGPGCANAIGGQFAAIKTAGRWVDEMIVKAPAAMKFALGENPKWTYKDRDEAPVTRMATAALIREQLSKAQEYLRKQEKAKGDEDAEPPEFDAKLEALVPVIQKKLPAHFHAHKANDIATAVRIAKEFDLDAVIVHCTEGHLIAPLLAQEGMRVITGPIFGDRSKPELRHQELENTAVLQKAGVATAICTDHPENPIQYLPLGAALAVKAGVDPEEALLSITLRAAQIGGVADRVGSLSVGKDADIAVLSGSPFDMSTRVEMVWINGQQVK